MSTRSITKLTVWCIAFVAAHVQAETNLWMSCADPLTPDGARLSPQSCATLSWIQPKGDSLLATCLTCNTWNGVDAGWRRLSSLPAGTKGILCTADVQSSTFTAGIESADPCPVTAKTWAVIPTLDTTVTRTLTWRAPVSNEDFSALIDLAGYRILFAPRETGPWRQLAAPAATSAEMTLKVQADKTDRCAQIIARTTGGSESAPAVVCLAGSRPNPPTDAVLR